jgi:hypothetical protein
MIDVKSKDGASAIALATLLKARGLTDAFVLCQSTACLRGVKEVDGRFQTVYGAPITWDSTLGCVPRLRAHWRALAEGPGRRLVRRRRDVRAGGLHGG